MLLVQPYLYKESGYSSYSSLRWKLKLTLLSQLCAGKLARNFMEHTLEEIGAGRNGIPQQSSLKFLSCRLWAHRYTWRRMWVNEGRDVRTARTPATLTCSHADTHKRSHGRAHTRTRLLSSGSSPEVCQRVAVRLGYKFIDLFRLGDVGEGYPRTDPQTRTLHIRKHT